MLPYHSEALFFEMQEKKYNWLASHPTAARALFAVIAIESAISPLILGIAKVVECIALGCLNGFGAMLGRKDCSLKNCLESLSIICVAGQVVFSPIFAIGNLFGLLFYPKFTVKASEQFQKMSKFYQDICNEKRSGLINDAGRLWVEVLTPQT